MTARPPAPGVDVRQVGLVLRARWRIGVRSATRSPGRLLAALLGILLQVTFVCALTAFAGIGTLHLLAADENGLADAAIHAGFLVTFLWLATSPPLGLRGNEFLDVTKLFTLPVSPRTVLAATLTGLATTTSALMLVLPLACAVVVRARGFPDAAVGLAAVAVTAGLGILSGQTLLLLFLGVFRSRRWRDLSVVLLTVLSASVYLVVRFGLFGSGGGAWRPALLAFAEWKDWLLVLPSWWGAHAATGSGVARVLPLCAALPLGWLLFRAASGLVERAFHGEIEEQSSVAPGARGRRDGLPGFFSRLLPDPLGALVEKDLRILGRDPSMRLQFLHHLAYLGVPLVVVILRDRGPDRGGFSAIPSLLVPAFLFASLPLYLNPLGSEGAGIAHTLATPVSRFRWLLGKSLAHVIVLGGASGAIVLAAGTGLVVALSGTDLATAAGHSAIAAVECLSAAGVAAGVGTVAGVVAPTRTVRRDRRVLSQTSGGRGGCLRALFGLGAAMAVFALLVPVALAFHLPAALPSVRAGGAWTAIALPFSLLWGALVLLLGTWAGAAVAVRREEALVAELSRSES